jgi:hypothetical protein
MTCWRTITGTHAYGLGFCASGAYAIGAIDPPAISHQQSSSRKSAYFVSPTTPMISYVVSGNPASAMVRTVAPIGFSPCR